MDSWISHWRQKSPQKQKWTNLLLGLIGLLVVSFAITGYAWARKDVRVVVDGETRQIASFAQDIGQMLADEGIILQANDQVEPAVDFPLKDGLEITVTRAFKVPVEVDGGRLEVATIPVSVRELLSKAEVELNPGDRVEPDLDKQVSPGTEIKIIRVITKEVVEEEELPFQVVRRTDPDLERGLTKVVQKGRTGIAQNVYTVTYENGQEIKKELVSKKVVQEPVNEELKVGALQLVSRGGVKYRFKEVKTVVATAYAPTGNRTYTGTWPERGTIAVDRKVIPLGTKLYVEGYGAGKAEDIGSAIKGNRIDVFVDTEEEAVQWGRRKVKVYILE